MLMLVICCLVGTRSYAYRAGPGVPGVAGFGEVLVRGAVFPVIPLVSFFWELTMNE